MSSRCEQCIVRNLNGLKALTKEELVRISNCKTSKFVKKGDMIFDEGETLNGVYCVRDGVCKVSKLSENGKSQIIKLLKKGDILGQRSLINEETTNLSAIAVKDMELCFIPKQEILNDLHNNTNFSFELIKQMATNLKDTDNMMVDMAQKSVKQRLAETLVYIHDNFGVDEEGMLSVVLSREEYSDIVGTATESAIRILSQFKKDGLISVQGKKLKIDNYNELVKLSKGF